MTNNNEKEILNIKDKTLAYIITLRSGGKTTSRIIDELLIKPRNKNQLANILDLDYKTVTYHIALIYEKEYIREEKYLNQYFYIPAEKLINNLKEYYLLKELLEKDKKGNIMKSETAKLHQKESSADIACGLITLSDSRKSEKLDLSGKYIANEIESRYALKSRSLIPDEKEDLINEIEKMISNDIDVILTNGGTGLDTRDITVETVESLFEKRIDGFGELFRAKSYEEIGSAALLSRATAGIYKKTIIFSMPGSPNAVKTALNLIIDELPHFVHHVKK